MPDPQATPEQDLSKVQLDLNTSTQPTAPAKTTPVQPAPDLSGVELDLNRAVPAQQQQPELDMNNAVSTPSADQKDDPKVIEAIKKATIGDNTTAGALLNSAREEWEGLKDLKEGRTLQGATRLLNIASGAPIESGLVKDVEGLAGGFSKTVKLGTGIDLNQLADDISNLVVKHSPLESVIKKLHPGFEAAGVISQYEDKLNPINKPPVDAASLIDKNKHPILKATMESAQSLLTPETVALMVGTGGAGVVGSAQKMAVANRLLSLGFSAQAIGGAFEHLEGFKQAYEEGNGPEAEYQLTHALLNGSLAIVAGRGAAGAETPGATPGEAKAIKTVAGLPAAAVKAVIPEGLLKPESAKALQRAIQPGVNIPTATESIEIGGPRLQQLKQEGKITNEDGEVLDEIKTPDDLLDAVRAGKREIYNAIEQRLAQSGQGQVNVESVAHAMEDSISERTERQRPQVADAIRERAKAYRQTIEHGNTLTLGQIEDMIIDANKELRNFYKQPVVGENPIAPQMEATLAEVQKLRQLQDETVDKLTGEGTVDLKREYGAMRDIERATARQKAISNRIKGASLYETLATLYAAGDVLTGNFVGALKAGTKIALGQYLKGLRDPNKLIDSAFQGGGAFEPAKPIPPAPPVTGTPLPNQPGRPFPKTVQGGPGTGAPLETIQQPHPGTNTPLHAELATHYGEQFGQTSYEELEQRLLQDAEAKKQRKEPLEAGEKSLLGKINTGKAKEAAKLAKVKLDMAAAVEAIRPGAVGKGPIGSYIAEATEPTLEIPEERLPKGHTQQSAIGHEVAHATVGALEGLNVGEIASHEHEAVRARPKAAASTMYNERPLALTPGHEARYTPAEILANTRKWLTSTMAGAAWNELSDGIPFEQNTGLASDIDRALTFLKAADVPEDQWQSEVADAFDRAKEHLSKPEVSDIIKRNIDSREENLPTNLHFSPARIRRIVEAINAERDRSLRGTAGGGTGEETPSGSKPTGEGEKGKSSQTEGKTKPAGKEGLNIEAAEPAEIAKQTGHIYKGELTKGSGVHMFERPDQPGKTFALNEPVTAEKVKAASARKMEEFGIGQAPVEEEKGGLDKWLREKSGYHPDLQKVIGVTGSLTEDPSGITKGGGFITPDGQFSYVSPGSQHPELIKKALGQQDIFGDNRVKFINDTKTIRTRFINGRQGPSLSISIPKDGVTPEQVDAIKKAVGQIGRYGNLTIETADRSMDIKTASKEFVRPSDVEQMLQNLEPITKPSEKTQLNLEAATETAKGADEFNKERGLPPINPAQIGHNPEFASRIADAYEAMKHEPENPAVKKSYDALKQDIQQQWDFAQNKMGVKFEPWTKEGQPYANSKEMSDDVNNNKHLYFYRGGEMPADHPLSETDKTGLTYNDKLRAVHAAQGFQFGPKGEENAWNLHRQMFSQEAIPALTSETRGQNSWVNFGPQLRNEAGVVPAKGEPGYVPPPERPFAQQKAGLLPEEFQRIQTLDQHQTARNLAKIIGGKVVGSAAEVGTTPNDIDIRVENHDDESFENSNITKNLEAEGFKRTSSQLVSPKEAQESGKPYAAGWQRAENFEGPNGEKLDVWHDVETPDQQKGLVSTRLPQGKKATENPLAEDLRVGREAIDQVPGMAQKMAKLVRQYPGVRIPENITDPNKVLNRFVDHVKENLTRLYEAVPKEQQQANSKWYDSANTLAKTMAEKYGKTVQQIAGVIAAMSPQREWNQNVSLAERVNDTYHTKQDAVTTPEMMDKGAEIAARPTGKIFNVMAPKIAGKTLGELTDPIAKAAWIRLYDEVYNSRDYKLIDPATGQPTETATDPTGRPIKVAWGSLRDIGKAVSILQDGSRENISNRLGDAHKVRNFYNNILDPNNPRGDVTIDTHAVAAGLMRMLGGNATEVLHNFGAGGAPKSSVNGIKGTYPLFADAYREAAADLGVQPRQLQSVVWEAIRQLFPRDMKHVDKYVTGVDDLWKQYQDRKISLDKLHDEVRQYAGQAANEMNQARGGQNRMSAFDFIKAMNQAGFDAMRGK